MTTIAEQAEAFYRTAHVAVMLAKTAELDGTRPSVGGQPLVLPDLPPTPAGLPQEIIDRIFRERTEGGLTGTQIAHHLNADGVAPGTWTTADVQAVFGCAVIVRATR